MLVDALIWLLVGTRKSGRVAIHQLPPIPYMVASILAFAASNTPVLYATVFSYGSMIPAGGSVVRLAAALSSLAAAVAILFCPSAVLTLRSMERLERSSRQPIWLF